MWLSPAKSAATDPEWQHSRFLGSGFAPRRIRIIFGFLFRKGSHPMIRVDLTTFLDIVGVAGTPKLTAVRRLKQRGKYNPAHDFWLPLRRMIVKAHQQEDAGLLDHLLPMITDKKKLSNYPDRIQAHKRWWGKREYKWSQPPEAEWQYGQVSVRVNPELGLKDDSGRIVVKLYFKKDRLSKLRADVILHLLETTVTPAGKNARVGILDVPRSKLIQSTVEKPGLEAALRA